MARRAAQFASSGTLASGRSTRMARALSPAWGWNTRRTSATSSGPVKASLMPSSAWEDATVRPGMAFWRDGEEEAWLGRADPGGPDLDGGPVPGAQPGAGPGVPLGAGAGVGP